MGRGGNQNNLLYGDFAYNIPERNTKRDLLEIALTNNGPNLPATRIIDSTVKHRARDIAVDTTVYNYRKNNILFSFTNLYTLVSQNTSNQKWINEIKVVGDNLSSYPQVEKAVKGIGLVDRSTLVPIQFKERNLNSFLVDFYPINQPQTSENEQQNLQLEQIVKDVNSSRTLIMPELIVTVELACRNKRGSWHYQLDNDLKNFHLYYKSSQDSILGYLKLEKWVPENDSFSQL
jgi:hypothetical protein